MSKESARNRELAEQNAALIERNAELEARIVKLEATIEKLRELLAANSSNSSKPPSTDRGKNAHRNKAKGKKKRKRGPKKGHPGAQRKLVPLEDVDNVHGASPKHAASARRRCRARAPAIPCVTRPSSSRR